MKIDKKLIKELVDYLKEFGLSELDYQEGQIRIKVSITSKTVDATKTSAVVSPNKTVLKNSGLRPSSKKIAVIHNGVLIKNNS